jgi:hypothetical protein
VRQIGEHPARYVLAERTGGTEPVEEGSNAALILSALAEAPEPVTMRGLAKLATGGEPTTAFRTAVRRLVADGKVEEHNTTPPRYSSLGLTSDPATNGKPTVPTPATFTPPRTRHDDE